MAPSFVGSVKVNYEFGVDKALGNVLTVDCFVIKLLHHGFEETGLLKEYFNSPAFDVSKTSRIWIYYHRLPRPGIVTVADDKQHFIVNLWATVYPI